MKKRFLFIICLISLLLTMPVHAGWVEDIYSFFGQKTETIKRGLIMDGKLKKPCIETINNLELFVCQVMQKENTNEVKVSLVEDKMWCVEPIRKRKSKLHVEYIGKKR